MEDEIDQFEMLPRYWSKKKNQKILVAGLELDELEKKHDITKFDIEYYLPMDEDEALREQIRIIYLGYFENLQPQENFYLAAKLTDFKPNDRRTEQTYSKYNSIDDKIDPFIIIPLIQNLVTEDVQRRLQLRLEKDTLIEMKL